MGDEDILHTYTFVSLIFTRSVQKQIETAVGAARESWKLSQQCPPGADTMNRVNSDEVLRKVRAEWEEDKRVEFHKSLQAAKQVTRISFMLPAVFDRTMIPCNLAGAGDRLFGKVTLSPCSRAEEIGGNQENMGG